MYDLILDSSIIGFNQISALFTWQVGLIAWSERRDSIYNPEINRFRMLLCSRVTSSKGTLLKRSWFCCLHCFKAFSLHSRQQHAIQFSNRRDYSIFSSRAINAFLIFCPRSVRIGIFCKLICRTQSARHGLHIIGMNALVTASTCRQCFNIGVLKFY
jgi:hypothetical protein